MKLEIGELYKVIDIPEAEHCLKCKPCIRLRLMEMGFICGEIIKIKLRQNGVYLVSLLTNGGEVCQTIALRDSELNKIVLEKL